MTTRHVLAGVAMVGFTAWEIYKDYRARKAHQRHRQAEGYTVTRERTPGGQEVLRFRGSYDDIMRGLGVITDEKPPLPDGLEIERLPQYDGGCPHCGVMSMVGEHLWRYQELGRTRDIFDNTTTYLSRCKKCQGFLIDVVDHNG